MMIHIITLSSLISCVFKRGGPLSGWKTPLMCAAVTSARKCVECLLELGADPNIVVNENGASKTALLCAFSYPDMEVIKMLCDVTTSGGSIIQTFTFCLLSILCQESMRYYSKW